MESTTSIFYQFMKINRCLVIWDLVCIVVFLKFYSRPWAYINHFCLPLASDRVLTQKRWCVMSDLIHPDPIRKYRYIWIVNSFYWHFYLMFSPTCSPNGLLVGVQNDWQTEWSWKLFNWLYNKSDSSLTFVCSLAVTETRRIKNIDRDFICVPFYSTKKVLNFCLLISETSALFSVRPIS